MISDRARQCVVLCITERRKRRHAMGCVVTMSGVWKEKQCL